MKRNEISVIIIFGRESEVLERAIKSASWAKELILVAANSDDRSKKIARQYSDKVFEISDEYGKHFSRWRNLGLKKASSNWVFYLDADEVITPELKREIIGISLRKLSSTSYTYYAVSRANHYLGKRVKYGGAYPDYVKRFFRRKGLQCWEGRLHERPIVRGEMGKLNVDLLHFTHRDLTSMMEKTLRWTQIEAKSLYESGHPPVVWWRILRMMATKFFQRIIKQQAWRDGTVGWVNAIFETFNTFIIYARLWEMQAKLKTKN